MSSLLDDIGVTLPVLAAPMAGGPTTPAMVAAASAGFPGVATEPPRGLRD